MVADASASEHVITPSVKVGETYDDNVFLQDVDDFEHLISPGVRLDSRTDRTELEATCTWASALARRR